MPEQQQQQCQHYETFHHICSHSTWQYDHSLDCPLHPSYYSLRTSIATHVLSTLPFSFASFLRSIFKGVFCTCPYPQIITIDYAFNICNFCPSIHIFPTPTLRVPAHIREERREAAIGRFAEVVGRDGLEIFLGDLDQRISHGEWDAGMVEEARSGLRLEQLRAWAVQAGQEMEMRERRPGREVQRYPLAPALPPEFDTLRSRHQAVPPLAPPAPEPGEEEDEDEETECGICFEAILPAQHQRARRFGSAGDSYDLPHFIVALPCPAHHTFHYECIIEWVRIPGPGGRRTCPMDRVVVTRDDCEREFKGPFVARWWWGERFARGFS